MKSVTYYLSLISPWTYLGSGILSRLAREQGVEIKVRPVDLGKIFPQTGGVPLPKRAPARQAYRLQELERWREARGLPLNLHPRYFPAPQEKASHLVIAAEQVGGDPLKLAHALLRAVWAEERDISDPETLYKVAEECGEDVASLRERADDPGVGRLYESYTDEALAAGVFGAPTYLLDGELFWGQDRLDFLEARLRS